MYSGSVEEIQYIQQVQLYPASFLNFIKIDKCIVILYLGKLSTSSTLRKKILLAELPGIRFSFFETQRIEARLRNVWEAKEIRKHGTPSWEGRQANEKSPSMVGTGVGRSVWGLRGFYFPG